MPFMKHFFVVFILFSFIISSCISSNKKLQYNSKDLVNVDTLQLGNQTIIKTHLEGFFQIDSNSVLPAYDSTLNFQNNFIKELIESKSTFKLKKEWYNGNDSPSNGIWLTHENDTVNNYFIINTLEGKLDIHGSSVKMVQKGIQVCQKLFVNEFQNNIKRDKWLLPKVHIEYNYTH